MCAYNASDLGVFGSARPRRAGLASDGQCPSGGYGNIRERGEDDGSAGDDVDERGTVEPQGDDADEVRGSGGRLASAAQNYGGRDETPVSAYLSPRSKVKTTLKEQWSLLLIVALAAWWVRDGLSKIEHAIDRLNDRVGFIDSRVADHETRIRTVERVKGDGR